MKKYDHVVIGSGVSGLTTAIILGKFGKKVALLEQYSHTAPLIRRFKRNNSWCDPGFHYSGGLHESGPLTILFRYLDLIDHLKIIPMESTGFDYLSFKGQDEYKIPYGYEQLQDYLSNKFPKSAVAVKEYIKKIEDINNHTAFINPDIPFTQFSSELYLNNSLESYLLSIGAEQKMIDLLSNHGYVLYGSNASESPMHTHAYIMGSFYKSASLVVNGGNGLVKAFENTLKKYDISIFTNCTVTGFKIDGGKILKGVYCKDESYFECDSCISTIHPKLLVGMLADSSIRPAYINRIKKLENTISPVVLFLEAEEYPEQVQRTNYYEFDVNNTHGDETDYIAYMAVNPQAETSGKRGFAVIKPISLAEFEPFFGDDYHLRYDDYTKIKDRITNQILKQAFEKFPVLKDKIQVLDISTPVTYNRYTRTVNGCMYGVRHDVAQRQLGPRTSVKNLFLAGQSIQLGVMGSIISGFIAASNIVDSSKLERDIRLCH